MIDGHKAGHGRAAFFACLFLKACLFGGIAAADTAPTPVSEWHWRLTGIIIAPPLREALFEQGTATRTVREGRQLDGWTIDSVRSDGVTLSAAGEMMTLGPKALGAGEADAGVRLDPAAASAERSVRAALRDQRRDEQSAQTALADATRQMVFRGKIRRKRK